MSKLAKKNPEKTDAQRAYEGRVKGYMPKNNVLLQCVKAFVVGGLICCIGQVIADAGVLLFALSTEKASTCASVVLIFLGSLFTGIGIYDKLGTFAGAGSIVPITGFANSIVAPAMEFRREGLVLGVGAKLFSLAGPVLVYGITASVIIGLVYWIISLL